MIGNNGKKNDFLKLTDQEVGALVKEKGKPKTGVFIADGNRRLILYQTNKKPDSDAFYLEYARFFVESLKKSIIVFFCHGLETLFFPLFGPSLLVRKNKFQSITIPHVYRELFQSVEWKEFYKSNGIRVRTYGDPNRLDEIDCNRLDMKQGVRDCVLKTASNGERSIFFGFMADMSLEGSMPERIVNLYNIKNRVPSFEEIVEDYYGQDLTSADFVIFSNKLSLGSLPPLITTAHTKMYYFPVPGFLAINRDSYRDILYDFLYQQPTESISELSVQKKEQLDILKRFYKSHKQTIIGIGQSVGDIWLPNLHTLNSWSVYDIN